MVLITPNSSAAPFTIICVASSLLLNAPWFSLACMLGLLLSMHHTFSLASDPRDAHFFEFLSRRYELRHTMEDVYLQYSAATSFWHVLADVSSRQRCDFSSATLVLQLRRNCDALTFSQCQRSDASSRHDQGDFRSYTSLERQGPYSTLAWPTLASSGYEIRCCHALQRACCVSLTILANYVLASSC